MDESPGLLTNMESFRKTNIGTMEDNVTSDFLLGAKRELCETLRFVDGDNSDS